MRRVKLVGWLARVAALLAFGLGLCGPAHAFCTSPSLPINLPYGASLKIATSLPVGAVIPGSERTFSISGTCELGERNGPYPNTVEVGSTIVACTSDGGSQEISPGLYSTGIAGIGMQLLDGSGTPISGGTSQLCYDRISTIQAGGAFSFSGTLRLVRIAGTIPANANFTPALAEWQFGVYNTGYVLNYNNALSSLHPSGTIVLNTLTCNVNYPAAVALPAVGVGALGAVGASAGSTHFSIGLRCDDSAVVGITMDAAPGYAVQTPAAGVLGIQGGTGQAAGVGVQILDRNFNPVPLQQRVGMGSIAASQQAQYDFYARYYRTATPVTPGPVSSALVFTFDYQ